MAKKKDVKGKRPAREEDYYRRQTEDPFGKAFGVAAVEVMKRYAGAGSVLDGPTKAQTIATYGDNAFLGRDISAYDYTYDPKMLDGLMAHLDDLIGRKLLNEKSEKYLALSIYTALLYGMPKKGDV